MQQHITHFKWNTRVKHIWIYECINYHYFVKLVLIYHNKFDLSAQHVLLFVFGEMIQYNCIFIDYTQIYNCNLQLYDLTFHFESKHTFRNRYDTNYIMSFHFFIFDSYQHTLIHTINTIHVFCYNLFHNIFCF